MILIKGCGYTAFNQFAETTKIVNSDSTLLASPSRHLSRSRYRVGKRTRRSAPCSGVIRRSYPTADARPRRETCSWIRVMRWNHCYQLVWVAADRELYYHKCTTLEGIIHRIHLQSLTNLSISVSCIAAVTSNRAHKFKFTEKHSATGVETTWNKAITWNKPTTRNKMIIQSKVIDND